MNAERLHAILKAVNEEIDNKDLVNNMQQLVNSLQNVVNQPQEAHQQALAASLEQVYGLLSNTPSNDFSPAWRQILEELGILDLLGNNLKSRLTEIFTRNQITQAVALNEVRKIQTAIQDFKASTEKIVAGFGYFKISFEDLEPGECEIGVLIPREAVHSKLDELGKELEELNFIFGTFSEFTTGRTEDFEIKTLSSSDWIVYLKSAPKVAACVTYAVEGIVKLYKKLVSIKKKLDELKDDDVPEEKMEGIREHANSLMEEGIEELTIEIEKEYCTIEKDGRRNEMKNKVRISLNKMANRVDKGYNIEVRAKPLPELEEEKKESKAEAEDRIRIKYIQDTSKEMEFMKLEGEPILSLPESVKKKTIKTS